jgi:tRNA A37 threonylcarbamoyladenosine modification protein TsaB
LAFAARLPVIAVPTLAAIAQAGLSRARLGARARVPRRADARGLPAAYCARADDGQEVAAPAVCRRKTVVARHRDRKLGAGGNGFAAYPELVARPRAGRPMHDAPDAQAIGELALPRLAAAKVFAAADALPVYVRHRVA